MAKKSKTGNAAHGKHTLDTPKVKKFLDFLLLPENLILGQSKAINKYDSLYPSTGKMDCYRPLKVEGFEAAYNTARAKFMVSRAWEGLIANSGKQTLIEQKLDKDGNVHDCAREIPADTNACLGIIKLLDKNPISGQESIADFFRRAADLVDGKE